MKPDDLDRELREEIEAHIAMRAAHDGSDPTAARKRFGNAGLVQEDMRRMHVSLWLDELRQDLRYAWRRAIQMPGFTLAVITAIALGVGSSTAVFSVVDRILFRPLPYANEEQLVWLGMTAPIGSGEEFIIASDYYDWKERQTVFSHFTASGGTSSGYCDITEAGPMRAQCFAVDYDYFDTFGIPLAAGRVFEKGGDPQSIVISHELSQGRFGGAQNAVGKTLQLDGKPWRITGVLPANFEVPSLFKADIVRPIDLDIARERSRKRGMYFISGWARLKSGVTIHHAEEAMRPLFENSLQYLPKEFAKGVKLSVNLLRDRQSRRSSTISWALLAAVFSIVLIACANVANLFLARASASERDTAVRAAIGASRGRLIRQNFVESLTLAVAGGMLGILLGYAGMRIALYYAPLGIPRLNQASLDGRVLLFSFLVTALCGILCGVAPAMRRADPQALAGIRNTSRRSWTRPLLVASQIALASTLLYAAALLGESFWRMQSIPLGLAAENVITARFDLSPARHAQPAQKLAFWNSLEERLDRLPGVSSYSMSDSLPPMDRTGTMPSSAISVDGKNGLSRVPAATVSFRTVSARYFETLRIPILRGTTFLTDDRDRTTIISERLARRLYGSIDVVGRTIQLGTGEPWRTVRGVAANVLNTLASTEKPECYLSLQDELMHRRGITFALRTNGNPKLIADLLRSEVAQIDPKMPLQVNTMEQNASRLTESSRFNAVVLGFFSFVGLILGATGVYAVVSFLVSQRTREIGLRMALGATSQDIRGLILHYALYCAAAGCAVSVALMFAVVPRLRGLLFETEALSLWTGAGVIAVMTLVAILAALVPALRAARLHPLDALRQDG